MIQLGQDPLFQCDKCVKLSSNYLLKEHTCVMHEGIKLECHICNNQFLSNDDIMEHHYSKHEGIKNKCDYQKGFPRDIYKHIDI